MYTCVVWFSAHVLAGHAYGPPRMQRYTKRRVRLESFYRITGVWSRKGGVASVVLYAHAPSDWLVLFVRCVPSRVLFSRTARIDATHTVLRILEFPYGLLFILACVQNLRPV